MLRILIVGCGDIGLRAARMLRGRARVIGLLRSPERAGLLRAAGVMPMPGDLDETRRLRRLAGLADIVLHFAPPPGEGATDPRTRRLLSILNQSSLPRCLVYVSTSGVYGDCAGASIDETRPVRPHNARAKRRVDAEEQLRAWGRRTGVRVSILRAPGIYAEDRMPEERVRKGLPALLPDEDIYTNHIHADDLARLALHSAFHGRPGRVYHAVDDSGLKMGDWFDVVADHLGLPRPPRLAKAEVMAAVTPAMRSFLTESRRLSNRRIKTELGFALRHPDVRAVLPPGQCSEAGTADSR
jgi:nucleoside-diphosphate-sugar epimerase